MFMGSVSSFHEQREYKYFSDCEPLHLPFNIYLGVNIVYVCTSTFITTIYGHARLNEIAWLAYLDTEEGIVKFLLAISANEYTTCANLCYSTK